ncbi:ATP-binding cassette subfamily B protein [Caldicellulosiruptor bescii]|uniref:ABC transporter related n=2 Tax=Caldicellulosiruptor bescii TaxID=31899 RepID=B9ML59_CALBD|nr:ATP-binding cassette domain-containing protein [Caldicellulosiruptor bescii]ACM61049.1 ABC transporter related [Caldicellulosiruptor bescii DSM 6725]PBC89137.1 ATP-binding cassette subfamily B protein [Caldicellulosiruptor bescii]PBC91381.1 ATP-binding cassette subfamily B protein [Caldicellulosiruptor bescii]PBD03208.1 ATP-binding cassette subfamily B protein [Caldicellulosiruptor bescii]PBD07179.1 ATP-binding cassette subfamily B protein [Caldicellulosiruptor bescii]
MRCIGEKLAKKVFVEYLKTMFPYVKGYKFQIFLVLLFSSLLAISNLISPTISKMLVDRIFAAHDKNLLIRLLILMSLAFVIIATINLLNSYLMARLTAFLNYRIKMDFFNKLQHTSLVFHMSKKSGEIQYRMFYDTEFMVDYFLKLIINMPMYTIWVVLILYLMYKWSPILMSLVVIVFMFQVILIVRFREPVKKAVFNKKNIEQNTVSEINEHFNAIELIKTLSLEKIAFERVSHNMKNLIYAIVKLVFIQSMYQTGTSLLNQLWSFGTLWFGANLVFSGKITVGTFMGFYILAGLLYQPIVSMTGIVLSCQELKVAYLRFEEYYKSPFVLIEKGGNKPFRFEETLEMRNVFFAYENNYPVLNNVNLILKPGCIVALTGKSGSGKSTFARIVSRLLKPQVGEILIDGVNIEEINIEDFRKNVGFLLQNAFIINGTLYENVTLGNDNYSLDDVKKVIAEAGLTDLIARDPKGLNIDIGIRGAQISLGEAQRIALARILLRKPKIVILDEPTSFLDPETEEIILNSIVKLKQKNSLILVITHKASTLSIADKILRFQNGSIVEI